MTDKIVFARTQSHAEIGLFPALANRHGLISGATGTGKTVTLQCLAEHFSRAGVPVFMADVKGDLAGLAYPGSASPKLEERRAKLQLPALNFSGNPVSFWDVYGESGLAARTTISEMGPLLLSRILSLSDIQEQVLHLAFKIADDQGLLLLDLKDLRALLAWLDEHAADLKSEYGNIAGSTIGAIQRSLLNLESAGADRFFGEPALEIQDLMLRDFSGRGVINILAAEKLLQDPRLYSTFLLWLLSELFEDLDEVGDQDRPRLVFFFDEAHLLFDGAADNLVQKIEQVVRLIRSKGVGVYLVTQNPLDVPDKVLGQLGNKIQHALRAFTPRDQKALRAAAETFAWNPEIDVEKVLSELEIGEALISVLDEKGRPTPVERAYILPPESRMGPLTPAERQQCNQQSMLSAKYASAIDRESAFETLRKKTEEKQPPLPPAEAERTKGDGGGFFGSIFASSGRRQSAGEAFFKSVVRQVGSALGREIMRGVLGSPSRRSRY